MEYTVNLGKESLRRIADAIGGGVEVEPLEVTENGEYTAPDGKAYSPVSVNVAGGGGSSDFSTAILTIEPTNNGSLAEDVFAMYYNESLDGYIAGSIIDETSQIVVPVILDVEEGAYGETSGNIVYDSDKSAYIITGNCKVQRYRGGSI